ncbi:Ribosomal RNA small subunit methyltransferase E [Bienertia sinuspersici]
MMPLQRAKLLNSPCFNSFSHQWMKPTIVAVRAFSAASDHSNQSRGVRVQGDEFWHMTKVLRLKVKDRIELFNGKGGLVEGSIDRVDRAGLDFMAIKDPIIVHPHKPQWDVYAAFGTLKGGRADWLVEKCTELGASTVTPLLTERSPLISENRVERLQRVIIAATKQCQRLHEMILNPPMEVGSILPTVAESISFVAAAEGTPVIRTLTSSANESRGSLIIGPEGDFTEQELKMITKAGATAVGLGPHRLRVETASIALLATLMLWSDSQQP